MPLDENVPTSGYNWAPTPDLNMVFGFNTDIKHADTVYHVQSEERKGEMLLQTQVFVRGRCIGKRATSYAALIDSPDFDEAAAHEMLKSQHRSIIEAIRTGKLDEALAATETPVAPKAPEPTHSAPEPLIAMEPELPALDPVPAPEPPHQGPPVAPAPSGHGLTLELMNPATVLADDTLTLQVLVSDDAFPLAGARVVSRFVLSGADGDYAPLYSQGVTDTSGVVEAKLFLDQFALTKATILVQATHAGKTVTRKYVVKGR